MYLKHGMIERKVCEILGGWVCTFKQLYSVSGFFRFLFLNDKTGEQLWILNEK